ncbi:pseudouridine synthase [Synechococcus sp. CBW1006]|uniref:pseudouridine synthase n=1 Tax=Synechococcus sp. CBW1006 TaxID=1353138 RepID=UPI001E562D83|nr:pseudouridine synthase [Synechococcus sp. CBW1006]
MAGPPLTHLLFHKPYGVLSQFTPEPESRWDCLASFIPVPGVYAAGRLDADSEGLLLLTDHGPLQHRLTDPAWGHWRTYWVQVEGEPSAEALQRLAEGVMVQGERTLPARARALPAPQLPERVPPIRHRLTIPTAWLELQLREGRNRQVRRMTAAVGHPTLRLVRASIDLMDGEPPLNLSGLDPGRWRALTPEEDRRVQELLRQPASGQPSLRTLSAGRSPSGRRSPGRGGRAGGGKSGRAGGGG